MSDAEILRAIAVLLADAGLRQLLVDFLRAQLIGAGCDDGYGDDSAPFPEERF